MNLNKKRTCISCGFAVGKTGKCCGIDYFTTSTPGCNYDTLERLTKHTGYTDHDRMIYEAGWESAVRSYTIQSGRNYCGPWDCPVCGSQLDCQGFVDSLYQETTLRKIDLFCHRCRSQFRFNLRPSFRAQSNPDARSAASPCWADVCDKCDKPKDCHPDCPHRARK